MVEKDLANLSEFPRHRSLGSRATALLACLMATFVSCSKHPPNDTQSWTRPVRVGNAFQGFNGGPIMVHRYHDTVLGLQTQRDGGGRLFFMNTDPTAASFWTESPSKLVPQNYVLACPTIDRTHRMILFSTAFMENDQLEMHAFASRLDVDELRDVREMKWTTDKKSLLGETPANMRLNEPGRRRGASVGPGIMNGPEIYLPYSLDAESTSGNTAWRSKFSNGAFRSVDFGKTWQLERISDFDAGAPAMCRTAGYYYYFASKADRGLWCSRKRPGENAWSAPEDITKTYAPRRGGGPIAEGEIVHLCWLDRRHEKHRISIDSPDVGNYEVAYCRRKDSDAGWSKDLILSKGLFYSYDPSMSVEGEKLVIAWAGRPGGRLNPGVQIHMEIYFVASKDAGATWTTPRRVTDAISAGLSATEPQVVLQNGIIHLFYAQGKRNLSIQLSQESWPIYYQRRSFQE